MDKKSRKIHALSSNTRTSKKHARAIAFYLPQYYPISENNLFWGKGFTEWTNVTKARSLFRGHRQPNLPSDLGFYDLRVPETRIEQAMLAKNAGIEGFCYWHYWFGDGKRLLERTFEEVLRSGKPDFPFCLAWANESWTGIWHGSPHKTLIKQQYFGDKDYKKHFYALLPAFRDKRYMEIKGKKIFIIYRPNKIPNLKDFISLWQSLAKKNNINGFYFIGCTPTKAKPEFPELDAQLPIDIFDLKKPALHKILDRVRRATHTPRRLRYEEIVKRIEAIQDKEPYVHPLVLSNWDNTPRSGNNGIVLEHATPQEYEKHLHRTIARLKKRFTSPTDRIIFIKSWNEWAEGNYLEPSQQYADRYLRATKKQLG